MSVLKAPQKLVGSNFSQLTSSYSFENKTHDLLRGSAWMRYNIIVEV